MQIMEFALKLTHHHVVLNTSHKCRATHYPLVHGAVVLVTNSLALDFEQTVSVI